MFFFCWLSEFSCFLNKLFLEKKKSLKPLSKKKIAKRTRMACHSSPPSNNHLMPGAVKNWCDEKTESQILNMKLEMKMINRSLSGPFSKTDKLGVPFVDIQRRFEGEVITFRFKKAHNTIEPASRNIGKSSS